MTHEIRTALPGFSVGEYAALLDDLMTAGYALQPVEMMPGAGDSLRTVYLRHDVDLHVPGIEAIARVELERGLSATYFIPLALHFNPGYPENRSILRSLVADGHRIGLHYDLHSYPADEPAARRYLDWEAGVLAAIVEAPVESICMHSPWDGGEDILRETKRYVHPHAERYLSVVYVSDSCRAWRDDALLRCFGHDAPSQLLLNTHPELWLGDPGEDRYAFLNGTLMSNATRQHHLYVSAQVEPGWRSHPGPKAHDKRELARQGLGQ